MSGTGDGQETGGEYRTVSAASKFRPNSEMTLIGYGYAAILALLLLPLLPVFAMIWLANRLFGSRTERPSGP